MSEQQKKYQDYLTWFEENVKDPANWDWMRKDKDCSNWMTSTLDENGDHIPFDPGKPVPYSIGEALIMMMDPKVWQQAISTHKIVRNAKYAEMSKYVNGDKKQGILSDEFLERHRQGQELNRMLAELPISEAIAEMDRLKQAQSDPNSNYDNELFYARFKPKDAADLKHVKPATEEPKRSIGSDILHLLWKHGVPVDLFSKKKLSVEEANKIGKK